jgi:hypothetical protein
MYPDLLPVLQLRLLDAFLSLQWPGFSLRRVEVGFVVDNVKVGQILFRRRPLLVSTSQQLLYQFHIQTFQSITASDV